jgi:hypothetical protein
VIFLLFVVFGLNQNAATQRGSTENIIYAMHAELANPCMLDPTLAEVLVNMRGDDSQLTEIEAVRCEKQPLNLLDIWPPGFMRYQRDLLAQEQWDAWHNDCTALFPDGGERLSGTRWEELGFADDPTFRVPVGRFLFAASE